MDQVNELLEVWEDEEPYASINIDSMEIYINDEMVYLHIPEDEDIVSGIMVLSDSQSYININNLYVHPDHRKCGYGGQLLEKLTELLDSRCVNSFLKVADNNEAQFLYKHYGFKQTKTYEKEGYIGMERDYQPA